MKPGTKPKPTVLKMLNGNPGRRPLNKKEPKPKPVTPQCPAWLDANAKKEWKRVAAMLTRLGILTEADGTALALYCMSYSRLVDCQKMIDKSSVIVKQKGVVVTNPAAVEARLLSNQLRLMCESFGMTPTGRGRMQVESPGGEDEMEKLLTQAP